MAEHPLAGCFDSALADRRGWVGLNPLSLDRPIQCGDDLRSDPINLRTKAFLILEIVEHLDNITPTQFAELPVANCRLDMALEHALGQLPSPLVGLAVLGDVAVEHLRDTRWSVSLPSQLLDLASFLCWKVDPAPGGCGNLSGALARLGKDR